MKRLQAFHDFAAHLMLGRDYKRLSVEERAECEAFIKLNDWRDFNGFAEHVNRWKLDRPEQRTKRHSIQWSLLLQANQVAHPERVLPGRRR